MLLFKIIDAMIHKRLEALRKQKGFSQKEMADKLHKSPSSYNRMEKGDIKIALEELPGIAALLDCTVDDLLQDMASINIQQHNENVYAQNVEEQNNHADVMQLFDKLMEFQARQEEKMQQFMKEVIASLKDKK